MCNLTREVKCVNLDENVGILTMGLALVCNDLLKCSIDVMFEQGPECQNIFRSSISGVTPTDTDGRFTTSSRALDKTLDLTLSANPGALLLTILLNFGLEDVSDILVDPECPTHSQIDRGRGFVSAKK